MSDPQQPSNPYDPSQPAGQPYGQPGYGPGGAPWRPAPPEHPQATLILILGILGLALCQVIAPFAWVMGGRARKEIVESGGTIGGQTQVTVGWALGIAGSIILIISALAVVAVVVIALVGVGTASTTNY